MAKNIQQIRNLRIPVENYKKLAVSLTLKILDLLLQTISIDTCMLVITVNPLKPTQILYNRSNSIVSSGIQSYH